MEAPRMFRSCAISRSRIREHNVVGAIPDCAIVFHSSFRLRDSRDSSLIDAAHCSSHIRHGRLARGVHARHPHFDPSAVTAVRATFFGYDDYAAVYRDLLASHCRLSRVEVWAGDLFCPFRKTSSPCAMRRLKPVKRGPKPAVADER